MAKLILKFEDRVIRELPLDADAVTVGRVPDNVLVIDNPTVSSHHARASRVDDSYVLEDLGSTNGTFIGNRMIGRHRLQDGNEAVIGKHTLVSTWRQQTSLRDGLRLRLTSSMTLDETRDFYREALEEQG